ncbi:histamine H4 receptor-like [Lissotriton helveticus]
MVFKFSLAMRLFSNSSHLYENGTLVTIANQFLFPFSQVILLGLSMSLLSLTTVLGNTLVIVAFIVDKRLRNLSCYFLLNLAVCDFFVGVFSIPWYIFPAITGRWPHGRIPCKLWLAVDSTVCLSSVFSILLISYDRFLSVTKAVSYRALQGKDNVAKRALLQICIGWIVAFLLSAPAIFFWDVIGGYSDVPEGICVYEYRSAWPFLISSSVLDFWVPFLSVVYFNLSIYWNIRKRSVKRRNSLKMDVGNKIAVVSSTEESDYSYQDHTLSRMASLSKVPKKTFHIRKIQLWNNTVTKEKIASVMTPVISDNAADISQQMKLKKDKQVAKSLAVIVAFDTVNQKLLLDCLETRMGFSRIVQEWFKAFLRNRTQRLLVNHNLSASSPTQIGVPQGSTISPSLINLYMEPLTEKLRLAKISFHMYADDT